MDLSEKHLAYKKQVGLLKGSPVYEIATTGGFHLIVGRKNGALCTLGTGSHRAICRHVARKLEPDIAWTEMSKSDEIPVECYQHLLPEYEALTLRFRQLELQPGR